MKLKFFKYLITVKSTNSKYVLFSGALDFYEYEELIPEIRGFWATHPNVRPFWEDPPATIENITPK